MNSYHDRVAIVIGNELSQRNRVSDLKFREMLGITGSLYLRDILRQASYVIHCSLLCIMFCVNNVKS